MQYVELHHTKKYKLVIKIIVWSLDNEIDNILLYSQVLFVELQMEIINVIVSDKF